MSRRLVALALTAVLIASVLGGYGAFATPRGPASSPSEATLASGAPVATVAPNAHPEVSDIAIETYNGQGYGTTTFCTGSCFTFEGGATPGANSLYFTVFDGAADHSVNVTINDPNATRDDLTNPVFSATVDIDPTTHYNLSGSNNLFYTFPSNLAVGGGWNITASAPLGGFTNLNLTVQTYSLFLDSAPDAESVTIPGESLAVSWVATSMTNGAPYDDLTSVTATGTYYNTTAMNLFTPGLYPLPTVGAGSWTVTVPANATPDSQLTITVWAVVSVSGAIAENETAEITFWVGSPELLYAELSASPGCSSGSSETFSSGSPVYACIWFEAFVPGHRTYPIGGLTVTISFWDGVANATPGGNPPTSLVSTSNGPVDFSFIPTAPPFSSYYAYPWGNSVNLSARDLAATTAGYPSVFYNDSFQVIPPASAGAVGVVLNAADYLPGATVFANWTLSSSNASVAGALQATQWILIVGGDVAATGPISSPAQSGLVEIPLPASFLGTFGVVIIATNATGAFVGLATGYAEQPTLLVSAPGYGYYTGGETLSFPTQLTPAALPGTTEYYNITGYWNSTVLGETISEGVVAVGPVPASGSISFVVPTSNPATEYEVTAWAQSPSVGVYTSNSVDVLLATGFEVLVGVSTPSSYSDGSYQPGQTIQVTWSLSPLGGAPLPGYYSVYLYLGTTAVEPYFQTTSSSGTVSITIPSNIPSGAVYLDADVYASNAQGPNCDAAKGYCYGDSGITINAHPSVLEMELGAGSGVTVGWLILLIVILIVAVLLVLLVRRGRTPPGPAPRYSTTTESMAPPAPAPSSPPAEEWKSPSSPPTEPPAPVADAPPPLPTPPSEPQ